MAKLDLQVLVNVKGQRDLEGLSGKMRNVGRNMTIGVTAPLIAAGGAFVTMAADAEQSQARVQSVFDSMEASAWTSVDALNAHAEAMADSTTFDDDAVKDAQAVLLTFGEITGEAFEGATESAADLAAFFETDMNDAALTLGKALQSPEDGLNRLQRQGIDFTDAQEEMIRNLVESGDVAGAQAVILAEVQDQVGQVAEDLAATAGGQMTQAMNELGEAGEALGTFLLPVLATLGGWIKDAAEWFQDLNPDMQGFVLILLGVVAAAGPVVFVISGLVGTFTKVGDAFIGLSKLLMANPFLLLIAAIVAAVALIILNWDAIVAAFQGAWDAIREVVEGIWRGLKGIWGRITRGVAAAWEGIIAIIKGTINGIIGLINNFIGFINGIQIHIPAVGVGPFQTPAFDWWGLNLGKIPYLAEGGIVSSPTLAMIGEAGPEAVVPLDRMGNHYETHIHLVNEGDPITEDDDVIETLQLLTPYIDGRFRPVGAG